VLGADGQPLAEWEIELAEHEGTPIAPDARRQSDVGDRGDSRGGGDRNDRNDRGPRNDRNDRNDRGPRNDRNDRFNEISTIKMAATAIAIAVVVVDLVVFATRAMTAHKVKIATS